MPRVALSQLIAKSKKGLFLQPCLVPCPHQTLAVLAGPALRFPGIDSNDCKGVLGLVLERQSSSASLCPNLKRGLLEKRGAFQKTWKTFSRQL